ncbi:ABC transporter substrate-binding protein [Microbispora sp. NPDC049125]|uniref:ABC transporter substrate-binding protein n=1 Tax=Microbispora sp. NPDC049125 TaxID=3154929 RepID=UPI003465357F
MTLNSGQGLPRRSFLQRAGLLGLAVAGAGGASGLLSACSSSASTGTAGAASGAPKAGGVLKAALTGEPDSLDPAVSSVYTGAQVYDGIFSKLVDLAPDGTVIPRLATKWTPKDDKTWTFDLVDNAYFHNGEKFTGADVKYTFERILDPKTASAYAPLYAPIDAVEVVSPTQVVFHLKSSFGPFLTNLANNGEIVNQKAIESKDPARNPVGTGPFQFVEWVQGDHITLKKWDKYFRSGRPYLDEIDFRFLLVDQSRVDALSAGEINWADAVPLQQLPTLSKDPRFTYETSPVAGIPDFLAMNVAKAPFDKKEVRQAIAWAIDRKAIRQIAYFGSGEVGVEEVPSGSPWFDGADPYAAGPDIAKAKQLMAAAGYPDGLTIHYLGLPQYPELLKTGQIVADQLKQIGITMQIEQVDVSVWFDRYSKGDYEITSAYQERTIDPDNFYSLVVKTGGSINAMKYSNPKVDALIDQAASSTDTEARKKLYAQIRAIVRDDSPLIFVHYETLNYLMQKTVTGSVVNPTLELNLEDVASAG